MSKINANSVVLLDGTNLQQYVNSADIVTDTVNPTLLDYNYPIGKTWLNTISGGYFILRDNVKDNAIWEKINGATATNTNTITKTVATLPAGMFVSASDTDVEEAVLASTSGNYNVLGYIEGTGFVSGDVQVFTQGNILVDGASWAVEDIGKSVWLGTNGGWSLDYPVATGNRRVYLGKIVSSTQISLELNLINEEIQ